MEPNGMTKMEVIRLLEKLVEDTHSIMIVDDVPAISALRTAVGELIDFQNLEDGGHF